MKIDNREFFRLSFLYTAVAAFPPLLNLIIRPLIEGGNRLNPVDFSQIEIAETITTFAFIVAIYSMGNAISRFYYDVSGDRRAYNKLISSIFNTILLRGAFVLLAAIALSRQIGSLFSQPELQDFSSYGFASIIVGINRAVNMTAFALYRNEKKVRLFLILSVILGVLRSGFQLAGVFYYDMSFIGYIYGNVAGSSLVTITILIYTWSRSGMHLDLKGMKPVNRFARPLFQYALVAWGINFADRYFLEGMPVALGIYSQAVILGRGIEIILQGLQGASQPEIFRLMHNDPGKNEGEIKRLSNLLMAQTQALIGLAIIPAMLYCLIFQTDLRLASGFIAIVFIRYLFRTQYIIFSMPVYFEKRTTIFLWLNLAVLIINLGLLYLLVPLMGIYGAITAFLFSQAIQTGGLFLYQRRIIRIAWNLKKLLYYPFAMVIIAIAAEIAKESFQLDPFLSAGVVVLAIFLGLYLLYRNELKKIISKGWKQLSSTGN